MKKNILLILILLSMILLLNGCFEDKPKNSYEITDEFCNKLDGMKNISKEERNELFDQCLGRGLNTFTPSPGWKK